jgi:uncharacterized protein
LGRRIQLSSKRGNVVAEKPSSDESILAEAMAAFRRGDDETAIVLVDPLARLGNVAAQTALGSYLLAKGDEQEEAEAWLRLAAEAGDGLAAHNLGMLLQMSSRDGESLQWLQRAVDSGFEGSVTSNPYRWRNKRE